MDNCGLKRNAAVTMLALSLIALEHSCRLSTEPIISLFDLRTGIAVSDVNNDGAADIVVASGYFEGPPPHPGSVLIYFQSTSTPGTFSAPSVYPTGPYPWGLTIADIDMDGSKDIMTVGEESPNVFILYGRTSAPGTFDPAVSFPCGPAPYDVAVGDLNKDGFPDLTIGLYNNTVGSVSLLFQDHAHPRTFLPDTIFSSVTTSLAVAIGDLNGDGSPDIVATGRDDIWVINALASAPGRFGTPSLIHAGLRPQDVTITDFNGDGQNDIIVANAGSASDGSGSTISIILGGHTLRNYPSPNGAGSLVVKDFNGDGRPDVAAATLIYQSQASGHVAVWLQDTSGVLRAPMVYSAGFSSNFIAAGDLNQDGRIDLAVTNPLLVAFQDSTTPGRFLSLRTVRK